MGVSATAAIGFFLGFSFGVGCALAVMYSIYMGGYRAAVKDSVLPHPPERFLTAVRKASATPNHWAQPAPSHLPRQLRPKLPHLDRQRPHRLQHLRPLPVLLRRLDRLDVERPVRLKNTSLHL